MILSEPTGHKIRQPCPTPHNVSISAHPTGAGELSTPAESMRAPLDHLLLLFNRLRQPQRR